jgi:hypothetical protein
MTDADVKVTNSTVGGTAFPSTSGTGLVTLTSVFFISNR